MDKKFLVGIAAVIIVGVFAVFLGVNQDQKINSEKIEVEDPIKKELEPSTLEENKDIIKFSSYDEIKKFLDDSTLMQTNYGFYRGGNSIRGSDIFVFDRVESESLGEPMPRPTLPPEMKGANQISGSDLPEFSGTNIQVKNVDEPDYLKTDGKYIYIVNQNWLTIVNAYPPESAKVELKIALDINQQNLENMFLSGNNLVIFYPGSSQTYGIAQYDYAPYAIYTPKTFATIIDVSDKEKPKIVTKYEIDGSYVSSRMINDIVYVVTNSSVDHVNPILPKIREGPDVMFPDVYRFPNPEPSYTFNTITAFEVTGTLHNSETFLMGYSNTIYVSEENLYITYQKNQPYSYYDTIQKDRFYEVVVPLLQKEIQDKIDLIQNNPYMDPYEKWVQVSALLQDSYNTLGKDQKEKLFLDIQRALEEYDSRMYSDTIRTIIHKINLDRGNLQYIANSEVPGYLLNQFSMDEAGDRFRIATTSESYSRIGSTTSSNIFVFDEDLKQVGSLTKIAPEERIYSVRFMGDNLYLVTFKQVDPFFVIDLSSDSPRILGALKIPGFSNYLQSYDENHIIGIGRDTKENQWGGVQTMGVKVSIFDVSDFNNPKEKDTIVIGDSSTDSEALYSHKAFLLDKEKDVMSIPIKGNVQEIFESGRPTPYYNLWNGFFVYGINKDGFVEKGSIIHYSGDNFNSVYMPSRSLYIGNTLYTIMDGSIKMNDISDISKEINSLKIGNTGQLIPYLEE